ncbi:patatin-like phospholipase family protein [Phycicoccus flavus]|uniref:patatin-like phospholipase family protein n=1 Tax=Phycicoccus flavus TaxID=2502783 RepID=UPI000FEBC973|nr:patatin-like phospholipase family protein [Phycicoccus flavus]NHA66821.1 patatin-like phospholipase family protein [Phycicoccus flavus]
MQETTDDTATPAASPPRTAPDAVGPGPDGPRPGGLGPGGPVPPGPDPRTEPPGRYADGGSRVFADWQPPDTALERALVLAGGGVTGIAWEAGVVLGLRDEGVDVRDADTVIGTSAGAMVAAHLRLGTDDEAFDLVRSGVPMTDVGRLGPVDAGRYLRAQLSRDPRGGRAIVGRAALGASTVAEEVWLDTVGYGLVGHQWPDRRLLLTAVDAESGTSVVFDGSGGVPLERAVAASCAVPGVFPAVEIAGRRYVDGGLRSIANVDLAAGHARVLVLAPYPVGGQVTELPRVQAWSLRPKSRTHLVVPDARDVWTMGANPLEVSRGGPTMDRAREHGRRIARRVGALWNG